MCLQVPVNNYQLFWDDYHHSKKSVPIDLDFLMKRCRLEEITRSGKSEVLEIGCGTGSNLAVLSQYYDHVYGCDICEYALQSVPSVGGNIDVLLSDFENVPLSSCMFDSIFFVKTLSTISCNQHLRNIVKESRRLLKPRGHIVIIDFCFFEANVSQYLCSSLNGMDCAFLWPEWSDIPYVHHTPESLVKIFNPTTRMLTLPLDLVSCNGHISMGYLCVLRIGE
jgi:SAM-dependent methyltransferase